MRTPPARAGIQGDELLARLWACGARSSLRAAFAEVMGCELDVHAGGRVEAAFDPSFVQIALDDEHERAFGLYLYPPAFEADGQVPVVEARWEDAPCLTFAAPSLETWLRAGLAKATRWRAGAARASHAALLARALGLEGAPQPRAWARSDRAWDGLLPTAAATRGLDLDGLRRWLLEPCPAAEVDLRAWERTWTRWWVADVVDQLTYAALCDVGLEIYERLGWRGHASVLGADQPDTSPAALRAGRPARAVALWARVHPPHQTDVAAIVRAVGDDDPRARAIVGHWSETYAWHPVALDPTLREGRQRLGEALVTAASGPGLARAARARLAKALLALEFEEGLERLAGVPHLDAALAELRRLRAAHATEQRAIAAANDWSDLDG